MTSILNANVMGIEGETLGDGTKKWIFLLVPLNPSHPKSHLPETALSPTLTSFNNLPHYPLPYNSCQTSLHITYPSPSLGNKQEYHFHNINQHQITSPPIFRPDFSPLPPQQSFFTAKDPTQSPTPHNPRIGWPRIHHLHSLPQPLHLTMVATTVIHSHQAFLMKSLVYSHYGLGNTLSSVGQKSLQIWMASHHTN